MSRNHPILITLSLCLLSAGGLSGCGEMDTGGVSPGSCGDGQLDSGEACDDGNTKPGDGCDIACKVQVGYTCAQTGPSACTPISRTNPASVMEVGGGAASHLIRKLDGSVWNWGANVQSKLGNPAFNNGSKVNFPVQVVGANGQGFLKATAVIAGEYSNFALQSDGTVWSWGDNSQDELGSGVAGTPGASPRMLLSPVPVEVMQSGNTPLTAIVALGSRGAHMMALDSAGNVWTWGDNSAGQLGNEKIGSSGPQNYDADSAVAVKVHDGKGGFFSSVIAVSGAGTYSIALTSDHTVWTWGDNKRDQLGNGVEGTGSLIPVQVVDGTGQPLRDIIQISGGWDHSLALDSSGHVWSWGSNLYSAVSWLVSGQLGRSLPNGATKISTADLVLDSSGQPLSNVISVSSGDWYSTALKSDGTVWSWGDNLFGQMADGGPLTTVDQMNSKVTANHEILSPVQARGPNGVGFLTDVILLAAREGSSIAVKTDGSVWTWGDNRNFQLGNKDFVPDRSAYPIQVSGLNPTPNP